MSQERAPVLQHLVAVVPLDWASCGTMTWAGLRRIHGQNVQQWMILEQDIAPGCHVA